MDAKTALEFFDALMDGCSVDSLDAYDPIECRTYIEEGVRLKEYLYKSLQAIDAAAIEEKACKSEIASK